MHRAHRRGPRAGGLAGVFTGLFLLIAAGACVPRTPWSGPPPREPEPLPPHERRDFSFKNGFITGEVIIPAEPAGPKPAVVSPLLDERTLLERGIVMVRFRTNWEVLEGLEKKSPAGGGAGDTGNDRDGSKGGGGDTGNGDGAGDTAVSGGERSVGTWMLAAPRPGIVGRGYFNIIRADVETSLPAVLDHIETLPDVDPERIGVAGSSTGGIVALEALMTQPRLAAGIVRVACGDYVEFLRSSSLALDGNPEWLEDGEAPLDADYEAALHEREPVRHAGRYPPRPLLMLNGAQDPAMPLSCVLPTAAAFARAYARHGVPERFRFVLYEDAGHDLGSRWKSEVLHFWTRWLLDESPVPRPQARASGGSGGRP